MRLITIDEIKIEGEENGFHLLIYGDDGTEYRFRIGLPDQFMAETRRTIGSWLAEGELVRAMMSTASPDDADGHDKGSPKHPMWAATHATMYDNREGK